MQALLYYRYLHQNVLNGNAPNDTPCDDGSGLLCSAPGVVSTTTGGVPIPDFLNGGPYSELDTQSTNTNAYGASAQITNTSDLFGLPNHFVAGLSFDGAKNGFGAISYIGGISSPARVFIGPGVVIDEPGNNVPVNVDITDAIYGVLLCRYSDADPGSRAHVLRAATTQRKSISATRMAATLPATTATTTSTPLRA